MKHMTVGLCALIFAGFAAPAAAQPLPDPEGVLVEELIVRAREPGPAWWRVKDADTTVWILAIAENQTPPGLVWDDRYLQRRLTGANQLIVGNRISLRGGLKDIPKLLKARAALKSKTPLEAGLAPDLRARFVAQRERIGQPAKRYAAWTPLMAGQMLIEDATGRAPSVTERIEQAAKARKVKTVTPATYDVAPFIKSALSTLTPATHAQCLGMALDDLETADGDAAARAWAEGDVAGALRGPRSFDKCLLLLGGGEQLWRNAADDTAGAIAGALKTPGHAVAVVSLRALLAEDGIGARLNGRGLEVLSPGDP